jgi:ABC-type phosphate transport system permease subunit
VFLVIGSAPVIGHHLFNQGYSLAAVIAGEFGEATGIHISALFAAGLVLFVITLIVNVVARAYVTRGEHGQRGTGATGMTIASAPGGGES